MMNENRLTVFSLTIERVSIHDPFFQTVNKQIVIRHFDFRHFLS